MKNLTRIIVISLLALLYAGSTTAHAKKQAPIPPSNDERIQAAQESAQAKSKQAQTLEKETKEAKKELTNTKDHLVDIGRKVQKSEKILQTLERKIDEQEQAKSQIKESLQKDQQSISRLVLALERIRRLPPEALLAKPEAPLKTAQSAMLLADIIPTLNKQAQKLKEDLQKLERISADLEDKKDKATAENDKLRKEETKLSRLVEKRQQLYTSLNKNFEKQQKQAKVISQKAKNIKDLVQRLDETQPQKTAGTKMASAIAGKNTPIPAPGDPQLPISGIIRVAYNDTDAFGAASRGLEIEGRGGSLIVVPMGGIVRFAGYFKNYGNMVIIEHKGGYHSLIAGFEKIDTVVGQSVSAGEPIGKLHYPNSSSGRHAKPTLYYELRLHGEPINPAKKISGLS